MNAWDTDYRDPDELAAAQAWLAAAYAPVAPNACWGALLAGGRWLMGRLRR